MKLIFFIIMIIVSHAAFSASPVGVISSLSDKGELFFKIQNFSLDTSYDCTISYDLRIFNEGHDVVRTAANFQTKIIFIDKNSTKTIKAEFELEDGEQIAETGHAVKAPDCILSTKSRAVLLKNYYQFDKNIQVGFDREIIFKVDFKDIAQFEIDASREVFIPAQKANHANELFFTSGANVGFMNDQNKYVYAIDSSSAVNSQLTSELFFYNEKSKSIEKFNKPLDRKNCAMFFSTGYLACTSSSENDGILLIDPNLNKTLTIDHTEMTPPKDLQLVFDQCLSGEMSIFTEISDKIQISRRCTDLYNASPSKIDILFNKEDDRANSILKFFSYRKTNEEDLTLSELKIYFPKSLFAQSKLRDGNVAPKETLINAAKRLFNKNIIAINIIESGKEEFFDVFFKDDNKDGYYGRIYWSDLK